MGKLVCSGVLGLALVTSGCAMSAHGGQRAITTKTTRWTCPSGTRPDDKNPKPNCDMRSPQSAQNDQREQALKEQERQLALKEQSLKEQSEKEQAKPSCPPPQKTEEAAFQKRVGFVTGKASIIPGSKATLNEVATAVQKNPEITKIRVDGHADNTGSADVNDKLAAERAESVKDYLVEKGVPEDKLEVHSYSDDQPIASNDTAEGRAINRSVLIIALK